FLHAQAGGITAEDLIRAFSDGHDDDGNGYLDDISGWNFHRDTNDPQTDNSVYGHANGESRQVIGETDNALRTAGMCPRCRLLSVPDNDGSTSTGTPTQAGVAALVITAGLDAAQAAEIARPLSADEVKQVVRATVSPIDDPTLPFPGLSGATFNIQYGYGRPN